MTRLTGPTLRAPRTWALLSALLVGLTAACGDDPFNFEWPDEPDTVRMYSIARPELNLTTGWSFIERVGVRIEAPGATGNWDVALGTQGADLVLLPPGALGVNARGAIASIGAVPFDDVRQAPGDTLLFEGEDPTALTLNHVYVVRTNRRQDNFGRACVYYAKMEPLVIDVAQGILDFRFVASPICNSLDLFSPE